MLNVYRPVPRDLFAATPPVHSRRALRFFTTWYEAVAGVVILLIMALLIAPIVTRAPAMLLWLIAYLAYISAMIVVSRAQQVHRWLRARARTLGRRLTWLIYGPPDTSDGASGSGGAARGLPAIQIALAVTLTAAAFLFVVTLDRSYRAAGLPADADVASWLLFVLPMLRVARYASIIWIIVLGALVIVADGAAQLLVVGGADLGGLRVVALHACWLTLLSLLPAITLRALTERRVGLTSAIAVVRAITALAAAPDDDFASEAAALIAQRMGYDEVNVLLATSEDARIGRGLRLEPAYALAGGMTNNPAMVAALENKLGAPLLLPPDGLGQLNGAFGAALLGARRATKLLAEGRAIVSPTSADETKPRRWSTYVAPVSAGAGVAATA